MGFIKYIFTAKNLSEHDILKIYDDSLCHLMNSLSTCALADTYNQQHWLHLWYRYIVMIVFLAFNSNEDVAVTKSLIRTAAIDHNCYKYHMI